MFQVKDLLWNSDSNVLAVWLEDMAAGEDKQVNTCSKLHVMRRHLLMVLVLEASCPFHEVFHFD